MSLQVGKAIYNILSNDAKVIDSVDNGWELTVNITQNAATITYEYVFNLG